MTRQIVLDTETTGLDPKSGHRIIEIGCVELLDRRYTCNRIARSIPVLKQCMASAMLFWQTSRVSSQWSIN